MIRPKGNLCAAGDIARHQCAIRYGALDTIIRNPLVESEPMTAQVRHVESHELKAASCD